MKEETQLALDQLLQKNGGMPVCIEGRRFDPVHGDEEQEKKREKTTY